MKVGASLNAKALVDPNATRQRHTDSSFGGVLSDVADDAGGQTSKASPQAPDAQDVGPKALDAQALESRDWEAKGLDIVTLAIKAPAAFASARTGASTSARFSSDVDSSDVESKDDKSDDDKTDSDTNAAGPGTLLPDASLLALVQFAAATVHTTTGDKTGTADASVSTSGAAVGVAVGASLQGQGADPSKLLTSAPTAPIVTDVTLQSYLAPANAATTVARQLAGAPGSASQAPPAAGGRSASDVDAGDDGSASPDQVDAVSDAKVVAPARFSTAQGKDDAAAERQTNDGGAAGSAVPSYAMSGGVQADAGFVLTQKAILSAPSAAVLGAVTTLAAQPAQTATVAGASPARTMLLQLSPGDLGTVSVRLHLTGQTLDVSLTASNASTARLLDHDRAALTSALTNRDYSLNSLVIQGGDATSTPGGSSASNPDSSRGQTASNSFAGAQTGGGGNGRDGSRDAPARQGAPARDPALSSHTAVRGDSLFV